MTHSSHRSIVVGSALLIAIVAGGCEPYRPTVANAPAKPAPSAARKDPVKPATPAAPNDPSPAVPEPAGPSSAFLDAAKGTADDSPKTEDPGSAAPANPVTSPEIPLVPPAGGKVDWKPIMEKGKQLVDELNAAVEKRDWKAAYEAEKDLVANFGKVVANLGDPLTSDVGADAASLSAVQWVKAISAAREVRRGAQLEEQENARFEEIEELLDIAKRKHFDWGRARREAP